jgi:hypothetical protein
MPFRGGTGSQRRVTTLHRVTTLVRLGTRLVTTFVTHSRQWNGNGNSRSRQRN